MTDEEHGIILGKAIERGDIVSHILKAAIALEVSSDRGLAAALVVVAEAIEKGDHVEKRAND